jgi:hypothetical protein
VRRYLGELAAELEAMRARESELRDRLASAEAHAAAVEAAARRPSATLTAATPVTDLEPEVLVQLVGEETARVLAIAREAAAEIRERATAEAEALLDAAEAEAAEIRARAMADASAAREEAHDAATAEIEAAKQTGREMVAETQALRERMLQDLARRRQNAREQLAQLRDVRDQLLAAIDGVRRSIDTSGAALRAAGLDVRVDSGSVPVLASGPAPAGDDPTRLPEAPELAAYEQGPTPPAAPASGAPAEVEPPVDAAPPGDAGTAASTEVEGVGTEAAPGDAHAETHEEATAGQLAPAEAVEAVEAAEPAEAAAPAEPVVVVTDAAVAPAPTGRSVDELLARIRSARVEEVASAAAAAATATGAAGAVALVAGEQPPAEVDLRSASEAPAASEVDDTGEHSEPGETPPPGGEPFAERDQLLEPIVRDLARHLKRALADDQNEALDQLRRSRAGRSVDDVLGSTLDQSMRFRLAATEDLWSAFEAGFAAVAGRPAPERGELLDELLAEVDREVTQPLRRHLEASLSPVLADPAEAADRLRAAYRDWKLHRVDELATHLVLIGHGRGTYEAIPDGAPICWRLDPSGPACADAEDNVLGGVVTKGTAFPTGHRWAPAHHGCRCGIVPLDS